MTLYQLAERFVGEVRERPSLADDPFILWALECVLPAAADLHDEIPWCSAFLNRLAWLARLPRSKSAAARSWLQVGLPIALEAAVAESDVVILKRGAGAQPGPDVIAA